MSCPIIYPFTDKINPLNCEKKDWPLDKPLGVMLHDSADRDISRVMSWLNHENLGYHILINRDGSIVQTCGFNKRIDHAGNAVWKSLSPNRHHIAVCIVSWGKLKSKNDKFYAWNKEEIPFDDVEIRADFNGNSAPYDKATKKQEESLILLLEWFVSIGIDPYNICGHDEACIPVGRKTDPGGVLSFSTASIRARLYSQRGII